MKDIYRLGGKGAITLDLRFIAATNRDPEQLLKEGKFREDLYYRLNVARVHLPPLRDRKEEIPYLLEFFIHKLNSKFGLEVEGLEEEAMIHLFNYHWPGNIRELYNVLEATFLNFPSRMIAFKDLPQMYQIRMKNTEGSAENERGQLLTALFSTKWNKSKAAKKLNWSRMTLYRKMAKHEISILAQPVWSEEANPNKNIVTM